ncbi:MAG: dTDP-4-dehydrorhamnose 3,5-epimerase [Omnitrophica bacterium RIFCSPLOWO2_01_FULL_45_10]|nr:MAG: dTDP-4-dehydrorhamnose 3,5-epimerase [Omnitrophica bacterium RIFCSPLOWO2_01_FULL_45_10]
MIDGVLTKKLQKIEDNRGKVMHMITRDSPVFTTFGEIYFSSVNSGAVKAWRKHLKMTQCFAVPVGRVKLVIFDDREGSSTKGETLEMEIGEDNYCLVKIPPMLWYGFKGMSGIPALIANCTDIPHDPHEIKRSDPADMQIPYVWE